MLERLRLENFQCHTKTTVDLAPITVVVGPSDVGKSAVIRAIRWVMTNKPLGDAFIRHGEKSVTVRLKVDGQTITRSKGSENLYKLGEKEFKAFKDQPPTDVTELLNLCDDNFQSQMDPPFWFTLTAGEVARQINRIVDLGIIDESLSFIAAAVRKSRSTVEICIERLAKVRAEKDALAYVPSLLRDFKELEQLDTRSSEIAFQMGRVAVTVTAVKTQGNRVRSSRNATKVGGAVLCLAADANAAQAKLDGLSLLRDQAKLAKQKASIKLPDIDALGELLAPIAVLARKVVGLEQFSSEYLRVATTAKRKVPKLPDLSAMIERVRSLGNRKIELRHHAELIKNTELVAATAKATKADALMVLDEETEGHCPICGGNLV